jgi:phenylalanyl-tRNA synthetase beta chain
MRFSLAWLRDHLDGKTEADTLAERLTAAGMNVELREKAEKDEVWDVDVTANRPDAMNHRGLAREAAAAGCGTLRPLAPSLAEAGPPVASLAKLTVDDAEGCPRYCARVVRGAKVGPSPAWLAARLEACGIRSINTIVDATNYVLLDLGQPLHAFDLARLAGREIVVRRARPGENLTTLDEVPRLLSGDDLVIADAARPVAVAGVMGGAATEISAATTEVLLESAYFDPRAVRRTARRLGLATEASHRFERGADRAMARTAVDVATAMIVDIAGGEVATGVLDSAPELPAPRTITFSLERLVRFAGCPIPAEFVEQVLVALELRPERDGDAITCTVPSHRVDLELPEDLYEEVLRHFGYSKVPSSLPAEAVKPGERLGSWPLTERGRDALVGAGLAEAFTYSFLAPELESATAFSPLAERGDAVPLANPISARMAIMRRSLLGGLAEAAAGNLRRGAERVALGEVGRVFFAGNGEVREEERLGIVLAGRTGAWDATREADFLDLKGVVEAVLEELGVAQASWQPSPSAVLAGGQAAEIVLGENVAGIAGRLGDDIARHLETPAPLWVAEIDLACAGDPAVPTFRPLPRFPAVVADLTVRHHLSLPYAELVAAVCDSGPEWLEEVAPVARYRGAGVGDEEVKTTLRLTYRQAERSLTQEEVNEAHFALMESLARELGVSFT